VTGTTLSFNDTSAPMWTWYYYRISAVNAAGEGPPSTDIGGERSA
jgi:hypothetical protein